MHVLRISPCMKYSVCCLWGWCCIDHTSPPPPAHSQDCEATINVTASMPPMNVFADEMTTTCFVCFFGSPPTTNSMTTWILNGDPIPSSEGRVDDGVLVIFDPAVTFDIQSPRTLSCSSSAGTANAIFVQAVGKLFYTLYMQVPYPVAWLLQVHCLDTLALITTHDSIAWKQLSFGSARVTHSSFPAVLVPPGVENTTVNEGGNLTIRCESDTSTGITDYRWTGPDGANVSTSRTLEIANIQRSQSGVYTCFITNFQSSVISANATVTIQCECVCVCVCTATTIAVNSVCVFALQTWSESHTAA